MRNSLLSNRVFWLHVSFWVLYFTYRFIDIHPYLGTERALMTLFIPGFFKITFSYGHYQWLLPWIIPGRKYLKYTVGLIVFLVINLVVEGVVEYLVFFGMQGVDYYQSFNGLRIMSMAWNLLSFGAVISMLNLTIDRFRLEGQKKALESEKLNAELNYLKAQINPHFLFNTLHNLNYLTLAKKEEASEVIVKLSNIMRYMIYESSKPRVPLTKEVDYMRDYLDLEKIRLNNQFDISFDTSQLNGQLLIEPLMLLPFIENAFKHGVSDKHPESWVKIVLSSDQKRLAMQVTNSVFDQKVRNSKKGESGFGLENVKKRLALGYENRHSLKIVPSKEKFEVHLEMDLE